MKNTLLLLTLACISTITCLAQEKGSLNILLGPALPIGEFGSKNVNDEKSGLAKLGGLAEISYSHGVGKDKAHFGLVAGIRGRSNAFDKAANIEQFSGSFPDYSWSVSNSHWKVYSLQLGIYYLFMKTEKLDIRGELTFGPGVAYLPNVTIRGVLDTAASGVPSALVVATAEKTNTTTLSGVAKLGIAYHLNKRLDLLANLDFWYLQPTFALWETVTVAQGFNVPYDLSLSNAQSIMQQSERRDYKQPMNSLNLTVGLAYKF